MRQRMLAALVTNISKAVSLVPQEHLMSSHNNESYGMQLKGDAKLVS